MTGDDTKSFKSWLTKDGSWDHHRKHLADILPSPLAHVRVFACEYVHVYAELTCTTHTHTYSPLHVCGVALCHALVPALCLQA